MRAIATTFVVAGMVAIGVIGLALDSALRALERVPAIGGTRREAT